jgi:hypothetical protein
MQQRVKKRRLRPIGGFSFLRSSLLPPRDRPRTPGRAGRSSSLRCGGRLARRRLPPETGIAFAPRRAGGARSLLSPRLKTRAVRDGHQGPGRSFAQHPAPNGFGLSKSAASRRFVALSAARLKEWMARDLSGLGLLVIQIDGIHMDEDMTLVAMMKRRGRAGSRPRSTRLSISACTVAAFSVAPSTRRFTESRRPEFRLQRDDKGPSHRKGSG